ncbi:MAG: caspase family protein [Ferruginibacter sp.]|nr:caspase family protein [Ferruginibacter sp.]
MKTKFFLSFLFLFFFSKAVHAQSIYSFEYRFTNIEDTSLYHVFLVREEDGTGFYRVRFFDPETRKDMLIDMDMEQHYYTDKEGRTDETKIYFKGSNPEILIGDKDYVYYPERFWFRLDTRTGLYEPWAVTSPDEQGLAQGKFIHAPELLDQQDLTERYVGQFFLKDEEFYQSLFATTQRSLTPAQKQARLHLVIVANTEDEVIGSTCMLDKDRTLKTFKDLSEFLGIGFEQQTIFGSNYSKQNVEKAVAAIQPSQKDIVVFYYSGHGFKDTKQNRDFPNMALSNKGYEDAMLNSWNIEDVYNLIRQKGARFNLVISDCCNNSPQDNAAITCDVPRTRTSPLGWSLENCKALFMGEKPMSILTTAAQRGEQSTGNMTFGGYFTNQFRTNLINYFGFFHKFPTWDAILTEATKATTEQAELSQCSQRGEVQKTYKQHPLYRIQ